MNPIRTRETEMVYQGPTEDIGDLWCHRVRHGEIESFWKPSTDELRVLNEGGAVKLTVLWEPLPPVAVNVVSSWAAEEVAEHTFRVPGELTDPERR